MIRVWDAYGKLLHSLPGHTDWIWCLGVIPLEQAPGLPGAGQTKFDIISGGLDTMLRLWDITLGKCEAVMAGHKGRIRCLEVLINFGRFAGIISGDDKGSS